MTEMQGVGVRVNRPRRHRATGEGASEGSRSWKLEARGKEQRKEGLLP